MAPDEGPDEDAPTGWEPEAADDEVRSWLGPDERVVCICEDAAAAQWAAYLQPRGELGTAHEVPLTDAPTSRDRALSAARDYMDRNSDG